MMHLIIESLHGKVEDLRIFEKVYPLVEQKEMDGKTVLGWYTGKGQYEYVTNFDNYNGLGYFRRTNDIDISESAFSGAACVSMLNIKYALRFVCCIRRDQLEDDCATSDDAFAYMIMQEVGGRSGDLKRSLRATSVDVVPVRISTDRKKILAEELPGNDLTDINYEYSLIAIDFSVVIDINNNCMVIPCENYG